MSTSSAGGEVTREREGRYSYSINALRFVASLVIVLAHAGFRPLWAAGAPAWFLEVIQLRGIVTSLFFILSGFLLSASLLNPKSKIDYKSFVAKRLLRLYPIHLMTFMVMLPTAFVGSITFSAGEVARHTLLWATMTHGFFPTQTFLYNISAWAVTAFALGYCTVPFLLRLRDSPIVKVRFLLIGMWIVSLLPALLAYIIVQPIGPYSLTYRLQPSTQGIHLLAAIHTSPFIRLSEICMGSLMAIMALREKPGWLKTMLESNWTSLTIVAIFGTALYLHRFTDSGRFLVSHGLVTLLLIPAILNLWNNKGWIEQWAMQRWIVKGGEAAILMYFCHWPVFRAVQSLSMWLTRRDIQAVEGDLGVFALGMAVTLMVSYAGVDPYNRACTKLISTFKAPPDAIAA